MNGMARATTTERDMGVNEENLREPNYKAT